MNKRTKESFQKGIGFFKQAIEEDPGYALAYSGLADCYSLSANWGWDEPKKILPRAKAAAQKSIELDPELAETHNSLAGVAILLEWDWKQAEEEFKRAINLNPNYANAHHWYGFYFLFMERYEEAIAQWNLVLKLEPDVPFYQAAAGLPYYYMHRYDKAIDQFQKALDLESNFHAARYYLGWAYIDKKMYENAVQELAGAINLSGESSSYLGSLSYAYSLVGRNSDAQEVLERLKELEKNRFVGSIGFIYAYLGLGDREKTIEYLQKSVESRDEPSLPLLRNEGFFEDIRSDPRFGEIVRKMNLPEN